MYVIKKYTHVSGAFFNDWLQLWSKTEGVHFFNSPYWTHCCQGIFSEPTVIFAYYRGNILCGVISVSLVRKWWVKLLADIGWKYLDKSAVLFNPLHEEWIRETLSEILQTYCLCMTEISETRLGTFLSHDSAIPRISSANPYIDLTQTGLSRLSKWKRKQYRSVLSKSEIGIQIYRGDELESAMSTVVDIEARSNKSKLKRGIFHDQRAKDLFTNLCKLSKDSILIFVMTHNGVPIAHEFGFIYGGRYMAYHAAYVQDYRHLSPGNTLMFYILQYLRESWFTLYDASRWHTSQKAAFTNSYTNHFSLYFFNKVSISVYFRIIFFLIDSFNWLKWSIKSIILTLPKWILTRHFKELKKIRECADNDVH